jgi:hypothetical protein
MVTPPFCHSCGLTLEHSEYRSAAETFCRYCADEAGRVRRREEVLAGIASRIRRWQPDVDEATAAAKAAHHMRAMPHWTG